MLVQQQETVFFTMMDEMLEQLDAKSGSIEIRFPFFVKKTAPVSKLTSLLNYEAAWIANSENGVTEVRQETLTPVTSLCPCSKEISKYGAHNQRSHLTSSLVLSSNMSLEDQISISENSASCQLWARLKRADEKFVTEYAYEHPKFVEDIVRDMARFLNNDDRVLAYRVQAENFESIHNHSAFGWIEHDKRPQPFGWGLLDIAGVLFFLLYYRLAPLVVSVGTPLRHRVHNNSYAEQFENFSS